jgi:uncharacterized surface protein with fasciclin (FAS1) repeats
LQQNWVKIAGQGTMTGERTSETENSGQSQSSSGREGQKTNEQIQQTSKNEAKTSMQGYTIFAPSDDAFYNLPENQRNAILNTNNREENLAPIYYW